jgi:1-acyl-sn-glycerol-3-phosphate acyltransferase
MAQAKLFDHPWLGAFMRGVHVIPLQRGEGDTAAIREAVRRLRRGEAVAIFPEGGRQFSGRIGTAKRGVGLLAELARVPLIPVVVQGTFEALPPTSRRLHPAKIRVAFGPQIPYTTAPVPTLLSSRSRHEQLAAQVTQQWHQLAEQLNG